MENFQTGTQTSCAVTQALVKMDVGLTSALSKVRNSACSEPYKGDIGIYQEQCNRSPACFWSGGTSLHHIRRLFQKENKQKLSPSVVPGLSHNDKCLQYLGHVYLVSSETMEKRPRLCAIKDPKSPRWYII